MHTQVDSSSTQTPIHEIEEETDAVLLDVGAAKLEGGGLLFSEACQRWPCMRTSITIIIQHFPVGSYLTCPKIDCTRTAALTGSSRSAQLVMAKEACYTHSRCIHGPSGRLRICSGRSDYCGSRCSMGHVSQSSQLCGQFECYHAVCVK